MKFKEVFETFDEFKAVVLDKVDEDYSDPYWNDDLVAYTKNGTLYNIMMAWYGERDILYDISVFVFKFIAYWEIFKPSLYINERVFMANNFSSLTDESKLGTIVNNDLMYNSTGTSQQETQNSSTGKSNTLGASEDTQTKFNAVSDEDFVSNRSQTQMDNSSDGSNNINSTLESDRKGKKNEYDLVKSSLKVAKADLHLPVLRFLGKFNNLFTPWKPYKVNSVFDWHK